MLLSDVPVLYKTDSSVTWIFYRIFPDGTVGGFSLPKGKALVVTDVDWNYNTGEHNVMQTFSILMKVPKKELEMQFLPRQHQEIQTVLEEQVCQ